MNFEIVGILVAILVVDLAIGKTTLDIKYKEFTINTVDNPYLGDVFLKISDIGELTVKIPVKETFPETWTVTLSIYLGKMHFMTLKKTLCELMAYDIYKKFIAPKGLPAGQFPLDCPITPGVYEFDKYVIPMDMIPSAVPKGIISVKAFIGEPDQDPSITIDTIIEIIHIKS